MNWKKYCTFWKEMKYTPTPQPSEVLARGRYKGLDFLVINLEGRHPCGYVNVAGTSLAGKDYADIDIACHGGLTFSEEISPVTCERGWWIGWDYAHWNDYTSQYSFLRDAKKHNTQEVVEECLHVINQVLGH